MAQIVLLGAGGLAREVVDIIEAGREHKVRGYVVDEQYGQPGDMIYGYPILGDFDWLWQHREDNSFLVVCAVGSPALRKRMIDKTPWGEANGSWEGAWATIVHPFGTMGWNNRIQHGVVIAAGHTWTNGIEIGAHACINLQSMIGHDARVGRYAVLHPGVRLSGNVEISEGVEIGTGAIVLPRVRVGAWSIIGAGAVVTQDVPVNVTVVGVPAKIIRERRDGWQNAVST